MPVFNLFSRIVGSVFLLFFFKYKRKCFCVYIHGNRATQRHKLMEGPYVERISYVMRTAAFL